MASDAEIPILELQPQSIRKAVDLYESIKELIDEQFNGEVDWCRETDVNIAPRFLLFIDEVHQITNAIEQCLLKALEPNDRLLVSEDGREIDTRNIVFAFATTDRGDLFDALDTRTVKIQLRLYSESEVSQIVQLNFPKWPSVVCDLVAKYNPTIPREALAFARDMELEARMTGNRDFQSVAELIATDHRIDPHGMTEQRLAILTALGQSPISRGRLRHVASVKDAELQKFVLPPMLASLPDRPMPLVTVSNKGYTITPAGLLELDKREIPNQGQQAIPESVRTLFPMDEPKDDNQVSEFRRIG